MSTRRMVEVFVEVSGARYLVPPRSDFHHSLIAEAARGGFERVLEEHKETAPEGSSLTDAPRDSFFKRIRSGLRSGGGSGTSSANGEAAERRSSVASDAGNAAMRSPRRAPVKPSFSSLTNNNVLDRYGYVRPIRCFIKTANLSHRPNILGQVEVEDVMAEILQVTSVPELELADEDLLALRHSLEGVEYAHMSLYMGHGDTLDVINGIYSSFGINHHRVTWRTGHCTMEQWLKDRKAAREDPETILEISGEMRCEAICEQANENIMVDLRVRGIRVDVTVSMESAERARSRRQSKELDSRYPDSMHIFVSG